MSAADPASPFPSAKGFPTSRVNHLAKISCFDLIRSAIFLIIDDLFQGGVFFQTSKPFSADLSALLTSTDVALDAWPIISSFAGLITS